MSDEDNPSWIPLSVPTKVQCRLDAPKGINKDNYVVITTDLFARFMGPIYQYVIDNDKWIKLPISPRQEMGWSAIDVEQKILFIHSMTFINELNEIIGIPLNGTNYVSVSQIPIEIKTSEIFFFDGSIFYIGQSENNSIYKHNVEENTVTKIASMYDNLHLTSFGYIYFEKKLLLIGGFEFIAKDRKEVIIEFDFDTVRWNKLMTLPIKIHDSFCVLAVGGQYVLIFGGSHPYIHDNIYVYSIKNNTLKISDVKCPAESQFTGIIVNDAMKDEKLVFGYIRQNWTKCRINNYDFPA
eukprot:895955_1